MVIQEKKSYLRDVKQRYLHANKQDKFNILNEFCTICGYHRKYAIRLLNTDPSKKIKPIHKPGRKSVYNDEEFLTALATIWFATDQMCSKLLVVAIPEWLPFYEQEYGKLSEVNHYKLLQISARSIDRALKPKRLTHPKGKSGTKPGTMLKNQIPIRAGEWKETEPGFMEADTVAHCGNSLSGDFVWSLTMTDIATGWTDCRATWGKGSLGVLDQIKSIEATLPFPLRGFDCDNGSEFLNQHLLRYFTDHKNKPSFTRSRPYKKNDNAHVEQKNWTHVRRLLGYDRIEDKRLVAQINDLYSNEYSQLLNHFNPNFKLLEKTKIGSKYQKKYDRPATPYARLLESKHVDEQTKQAMVELHKTLNPFRLQAQIQVKLKRIFQLIKVTSKVRQRV